MKQADGSTVLSLENFKLVPGDVVSIYATAKDARSEARTDISFIQADPFEREFTQSQAGRRRWGRGRGGGGQDNPDDISQREKEIIAATWKQQGEKNPAQRRPPNRQSFSPRFNPSWPTRRARSPIACRAANSLRRIRSSIALSRI